MSQDTQTSLAVLLLDIKDEIDAAKAERRHVLDALQRARISELDRAFASLSKAEDFERDSRLHYHQRLTEFGRWRRRTLWLAGAGAALGALLGAFLLVWGLTGPGGVQPPPLRRSGRAARRQPAGDGLLRLLGELTWSEGPPPPRRSADQRAGKPRGWAAQAASAPGAFRGHVASQNGVDPGLVAFAALPEEFQNFWVKAKGDRLAGLGQDRLGGGPIEAFVFAGLLL